MSDYQDYQRVESERRLREITAVNNARAAGQAGNWYVPQNAEQMNAFYQGQHGKASLDAAMKALAAAGDGKAKPSVILKVLFWLAFWTIGVPILIGTIAVVFFGQ